MTLRFIIGRAGTGKTHACLDEVREELAAGPVGSPLILLVPEQATFQAEYALAATPGLKGFIRAQALSFRRLAYRVLQEAGGAARAHIGELGKRMVLRRLLEQHRDELKVFRRSAGQPGFADTLASALGELKTYCASPDDLAAALAALRGTGGASHLADKLEDIHLLYSDLEAYLADRFIDPDDYLNLLADRLELSRTVQGATVWVDGFTGFTPQEHRVLAALAGAASRVSVTLCCDAAALGADTMETDLFYKVRETYDTFCEMAAREKISIERPLLLAGDTPSRYRSQDIGYLEKYFFTWPAPPATFSAAGVTLAAAASPRAEVEGVAREITTLCRDHGYRYRDIVILARDLKSYAHLISMVFADHKIPVFIDQKRPVMHHPLVELVRSALEVVARDWSFDPVFRFMKTDLAPVTRDETDLLENYVLAHGIRGNCWTGERLWEYRRRLTLEEDREATEIELKELEEINDIRRRAVTELSSFFSAVRRAENVRGTATALYNLLALLEVPERLETWNLKAEEDGRLEDAREHAQVWGSLVGLLDQMVEALGDEALAPEEFAQVLDAGLESLRLGLIPPGLDQVVAGSLERSRSPEARAAFVLGVSDGVLPARIPDQGILTESERDRLQSAGLKLAPGPRRKAFDEQYLVYMALTRASERLFLSYPLANDEGGAVMPSAVVARVKELLPAVVERVWPVEPNPALAEDLEFVSGSERALSYLAAQMREARAGCRVSDLWRDVYSWFAQSGDRAACARVLSSLFYSNREGRLPAGVGRALYGRTLRTSVSGLERFRACPFAHFLAQGLKLQERPVFKLGAPDLGQFFHASLKLFGERIKEQGLDWGKLGREECRRLTGEVVDHLAPRLQSEILLSTARRRYLTGKLKQTLLRATLVLSEHSRRGIFRPVGLEVAFGTQGDLPAVTFTLADGSEMVLSGRIDRIDAAEVEGGIYLRVIDYKSGQVTISLADIYHGLKLQLLAYLDVAVRHAQALVDSAALPGAILYFRIDDPLVKTGGDIPPQEEIEKIITRELRMTGMVLADPAVARSMDENLEGGSDLIPVQINKNGEFSARSAVLTREQFGMLRAYLRAHLVTAGSDIAGGVVDIAPYRRGGYRPCGYCAFKPVCQFDILISGNIYRVLKDQKDGVIWDRLARLTGGEGSEQPVD